LVYQPFKTQCNFYISYRAFAVSESNNLIEDGGRVCALEDVRNMRLHGLNFLKKTARRPNTLEQDKKSENYISDIPW